MARFRRSSFGITQDATRESELAYTPKIIFLLLLIYYSAYTATRAQCINFCLRVNCIHQLDYEYLLVYKVLLNNLYYI